MINRKASLTFTCLTLLLLATTCANGKSLRRGSGAEKEDNNHSHNQSKRHLSVFDAGAFDKDDDNRYIVTFKKGPRPQSVGARSGFEVVGDPIAVFDYAEVILLRTMEDLKRMEERDDVEDVELDQKVYLEAERTPYGIEKVMALDVPDTYVSNRKVCIIDTGYDKDHLDLPSGDTVTGKGAGNLQWSQDGNGHGTHVAGTVAAVGGNDLGVVGVNRNGKLKLHIVRVFNDKGNFVWASGLVQAVNECVDAGANVVNMSLGGGGFLKFENNAYKKVVEERNVLIVAAAGNDGNTEKSYPASYDAVMSVAAVDEDNDIANFSQQNDQVDIAAPGVDILSTIPGNRYRTLSGTSMASPHVAGVAALVWSYFPDKSALDIREALQNSAQNLGSPGRDNVYGHGLVRADRALQYLQGIFTEEPTAAPTNPAPCSDDPKDWHDADGAKYNCAWYAQARNCAVYGDQFERNGNTANEACCACGGGARGTEPPTPKPSSAPTEQPSVSPSNTPTTSSHPSVKPSLVPTAEPTPVVSNSPSEIPSVAFPSEQPSSSLAPSNGPTLSPTASPSEESVECIDYPSYWYDSKGNDCEWYAGEGNCEEYGDKFKNLGKKANEVCCVCGGGKEDTDDDGEDDDEVCKDVKDWHNSLGQTYNCAWYKKWKKFRCLWFGGNFENGGFTAVEACCACEPYA